MAATLQTGPGTVGKTVEVLIEDSVRSYDNVTAFHIESPAHPDDGTTLVLDTTDGAEVRLTGPNPQVMAMYDTDEA